MDLNRVLLVLDTECSTSTCPEMTIRGEVYLCDAHATPSSCSAIDFCAHAIDQSTCILNSSIFPCDALVPESSKKYLIDIAFKLKLIFEHGKSTHAEAFSQFTIEDVYNRLLECIKQFSFVYNQ